MSVFNTQSAEQNHSGNSVQVISYFTSFLLWNNLGLHFMSWKTIHYQFSDNILIIVWCSEQFQWMMSHPQNSLLSREQIWDANQWEFNYVKKDRCSAIHQTISWQRSIKHKLNAHFYTQLSLPHLHQLPPSCTRAPGLINKISTYSECQLTPIHNCVPHKGAFFHQFHFYCYCIIFHFHKFAFWSHSVLLKTASL